MKRIIVLPAAERDLAEIWDYTFQNWGHEQADRYLASIIAQFDRIAAGTATTRPADNVRAGVRKLMIGRHVIYFHEVDGRVEVVRVLHQRMDFEGRV